MKPIELDDLRKMDTKTILDEIQKAKKELFKVRFEVGNGQSKSNHLVQIYKIYIAQMQTVIKEQSLNKKA
jgi:ribosomal protein L29